MSMTKAFIGALVVLLIFISWRWAEAEAELSKERAQLATLNLHVTQLEMQVFELHQALVQEKDQSIEGRIDDANEVLLEGWKTLLGDFKRRLEEAKKQLLDKSQTDQKNNDRT